MTTETTNTDTGSESEGMDAARDDFAKHFHEVAPPARLTRPATAQLQLLFKHTAGFAIRAEKIDWSKNDEETAKKKRFYLGCAAQVAKAALGNAGSGMIDKDDLIRASDKIVALHRSNCELRFIFCEDYDNMPR